MKLFVIDTSGWIEWLTNSNLAPLFAPYFKKYAQIIVPTLVQYELYKWTCRERNQAMALEIIGVTEQSIVRPLDTYLALYAADISKQYNLAMADAIVYATAQKNNAEVITSDKHFAELTGIKYISKN